MSFFTSNRFLVIILTVGVGTAYVAANALLRQTKDAARAPSPEPPPPAKNLQKDSENSLKIETLRTLADGFSYDLRSSAIKIVASRTARSKAKDLLLHDLASKNHQRRDDAIKALNLMLTHNSISASVSDQFRDPRSVAAVVKALIHVLPQHNVNRKTPQSPPQAEDEKAPLPPSPIRPAQRPSQEVLLLTLLSNMLGSHSRVGSIYAGYMDAALQAGLVSIWLANYPFPCTLPENAEFNYKRSDVARLFDRTAWMSDDPAMENIIFSIMQYPAGSKQMRQVGLSASRVRENVNFDHRDPRDGFTWDSSGWAHWDGDAAEDEDHDVRMVNGEDTAGLVPGLDNITSWDEPMGRPTTRAEARLRSAERSPEEEHLRRRHREAIVVAERGAPLRRENILQREDSQILQPMHGASEVESELNGLLGLSEDHRAEPAPDDEHEHVPGYEAEETLDPIAEAEVERELQALEEEVEAEAQETDRAQRRHREIELLIEDDPEIQGSSEMAARQGDSTDIGPDTTGTREAPREDESAGE
jgi:urease gamma subunit